jgi:hypothetical protein
MTLSIKVLFPTLNKSDTQHKCLSALQPYTECSMYRCHYAECYAECHYALCTYAVRHYAECSYAECCVVLFGHI